MQKLTETKQVKLEQLHQQNTTIETERHQFQAAHKLSSSCPESTMSGLRHRLTVIMTSTVAVIALISSASVQNSQNNLSINEQTAATLISALEKAHIENSNSPSVNAGNAISAADSYSSVKEVSQHQWGPSLVTPNAETRTGHYGFDPLVKQQQEYLMSLGFDLDAADGFKGPGTRRVFAEFRALYLPDTAEDIQDASLAPIMEAFAKLAHEDATRSGVDQGVVAAIRIASLRTGVEFSYLMKLASTESTFNPASEAANSSAAGLYQFTKNTWLNTLKKHGRNYRVVADYAAKIRYSSTRTGPFVLDETLLQHLFELRKNPRLAAMMAAETVREHQQKLAQSLEHEPSETDLYLAHFLGINNAVTFLQSLEQSPDTHAVELFPRAARNNQNIFQPGTCAPRTVNEVYAFLDEKLSARQYEDYTAN